MMKKIYSVVLVLCVLSMACSRQKGAQQAMAPRLEHQTMSQGGIIRGDSTIKALTLVFTAHDHADGADSIISVLDRHGIKGAFFFTGLFYDSFPDVVKRLQERGHYLGSHSDNHLLYMPWENRDSMLVTKQEFTDDMERCYRRMGEYGITKAEAPVFIPPYEYYNDTISSWAREIGLQVINYTPGTGSAADYTTPDMGSKYKPSRVLYERIMHCEDSLGLDGHLLLIHFGTDTARTDKFYDHYLDSTVVSLLSRGYKFVPLMDLLVLPEQTLTCN